MMATTVITKIIWNGLSAIMMEAGGYQATIVPEMGANMVRLFDTSRNVDIVHTPKADEMDLFRTRPQIFGLPLLFPPNRIEDGTFTYGSRTYNYPITLPAEHNHHHGTIRMMPFTVTKTETGKDYAYVEASYFSNVFNDSIYSYFPIEFECRMTFLLSAKGMEHTVTFFNLSGEEMPIGVGYHTPINVPFTQGGDRNDYILRMSAGARWELNNRTLPTGKIMPLTEEESQLREKGMKPVGKAVEWSLVNKPIKVDGKDFNGAIITDTKSGLSVYYVVDEQIKHWTLWNNGGDQPYVCPEPQSWAINAPNLKLPKEVTGFNTIPPHGQWSTSAHIYVK